MFQIATFPVKREGFEMVAVQVWLVVGNERAKVSDNVFWSAQAATRWGRAEADRLTRMGRDLGECLNLMGKMSYGASFYRSPKGY